MDADYPLLSDPSRKVATAYGVVDEDQPYASRWTFFIGADGRILYIDKRVSPATHGRDIVQKLAELGIPKRRPGAARSDADIRPSAFRLERFPSTGATRHARSGPMAAE